MAARDSQPYVGPRPFETNDRGLFFGREREADDILSLIMFHRTVLLYAQSGAGKSSLINTSIIPDLQTEGFTTPPVVRIRGAPPDYLAAAANVYLANIRFALTPEGTEPPGPGAPEVTLLEMLRSFAPPPGGQGPVLVFDQFEELFTTYQDRWPEREPVFTQIAGALDGIPTLRVLFSMREDFIAELDPLLPRIPQGIDARYRLELLRREAAISAVFEPARALGVTFDDAAANKLVEDLRQINVEGREGRPQQAAGEYVEPVQLQIVCKRLWDRLPEGIQAINITDLEQFGDVSEALREFYVAAVQQASAQTRYPEKLIHLGCTQFVTASGTRSMIHRTGDNVGMLPFAVVDSLVNQHFLRAEIRAGGRWYEISHDRLIAPVLERKLNDEELKTLLRTRDLLNANLENWRAGRQFEEHREILAALAKVEDEFVLTDEELEFLCMSSIGTGFEIEAWVRRIKAQAPQLLETILPAASRHPDAAIRRNAAVALAQADLPPLDTELVRLALEDRDNEVRQRAAAAIAHANRPGLVTPVVAQLTASSLRARALFALARMRDEGVSGSGPAGLAQAWPTVKPFDRLLIILTLGAVRLRQRWAMILYIGILGGFLAGLYCGLARLPAAAASLTITNMGDTMAKAVGSALFQGMAGGIVWGGATSAWIALGWILIRRHDHWMDSRYATNLFFGLIGGTLGGIGVFAEIFYVFDPAVLYRLRWLPTSEESLRDCIGTGYCLFHPALGPAFGIGIGIGLAALHASTRWRDFLAPHIQAGRIVQWGPTARRIFTLSIVYTLLSGPLLFLSAMPFVLFKHFPLDVVLGETASIYVGNIGTLAGILLGQLIMRVGFVIPPLGD